MLVGRGCKVNGCGEPRYGSVSRCQTHYYEKLKAKKSALRSKWARRPLPIRAKKKRPKPGTLRHERALKKKLKKKLWVLCKKIIRLKYGNTCYTCGAANLSGSNWHTAHFIPSSTCGLRLRYDLRNLRPGCYNCNINLGGNGAVYYRKMVEVEGQEYVDTLFHQKNLVEKESAQWYAAKVAEYEIIHAELSEKLAATTN